MQSALPVAVNRQDHRKVHLPLTCIIFDPWFTSVLEQEMRGDFPLADFKIIADVRPGAL